MSGVHCDKCRVRLHNGGSTGTVRDGAGHRLHGDRRPDRLPYGYGLSILRKSAAQMERIIIIRDRCSM